MLKTEFRIARCLCFEKSDHPQIKKCAIVKNGGKHIIQKMSDGTEYFYIDNPYRTDFNGKYFIGCIADAVRSIREDYADTLLESRVPISSTHIDPIVFIDRKKGEEYRKNTKKGWKDTKFGWGIEYGSKYSFGRYRLVDEKGNPTVFEHKKYKVYLSPEEALAQFNKWHEEAIDFAKKYIDIYSDKEKLEKFMEGMHSDKVCGIVDDLFFDMIKITDDVAGLVEDVYNLPNIGWNIVQVIDIR